MYLCYFSKWTYFTCFSRQKITVFLNIVEIKMNWNFHENGSSISPSHLMRKNILEYVYKLISIKILTSFTCLEKSQASRDLYLKRIVIRDHKIFWAIHSRVILVKIVQFVPYATFQKIPVRVGLALHSYCEQSWNMVRHVCISVNHSIIWWLTIWKPCHCHDITIEYCSIVRFVNFCRHVTWLLADVFTFTVIKLNYIYGLRI